MFKLILYTQVVLAKILLAFYYTYISWQLICVINRNISTTMKRIIVTCMLVFSIVSFSKAQSFHLGAKVGANFSKINGESFSEGYQLGYQLGGFAELDFNKTIGIQPEVLFSQTNTKTVNSSTENAFAPDQDIHLNYLSIPVLLRLNASKLLTFHVGPQFSILMNNHNTVLENGQNAFKSGDFAMVAGAQLNLGSLKVYGRYNIGLSDISDISSQDKWKSQQWQLGVGLRIL
jgi:hypothetical protein